MRDQLPGYKNPVALHSSVVERRETSGLLPRHPLYLGEWRAVCLHCQWEGQWTYRSMAVDAAETHDAWAAVEPGPSGAMPRPLEGLTALAVRLAEDGARLRERARCYAAEHLADDRGRLTCRCAERSASNAGACERASGDRTPGRVQYLAEELGRAFDAVPSARVH